MGKGTGIKKKKTHRKYDVNQMSDDMSKHGNSLALFLQNSCKWAT